MQRLIPQEKLSINDYSYMVWLQQATRAVGTIMNLLNMTPEIQQQIRFLPAVTEIENSVGRDAKDASAKEFACQIWKAA